METKTRARDPKNAKTSSEDSSSHETPVSFYILMGLLAVGLVFFLVAALLGL